MTSQLLLEIFNTPLLVIEKLVKKKILFNKFEQTMNSFDLTDNYRLHPITVEYILSAPVIFIIKINKNQLNTNEKQ